MEITRILYFRNCTPCFFPVCSVDSAHVSIVGSKSASDFVLVAIFFIQFLRHNKCRLVMFRLTFACNSVYLIFFTSWPLCSAIDTLINFNIFWFLSLPLSVSPLEADPFGMVLNADLIFGICGLDLHI